MCPSCEGLDHEFGDEKCLTKEKEVLIQNIMVLKKMTYPEARKDFYGEKEDINPVSYGETLYEKEFPELKRKKATPETDQRRVQNKTEERQSKMNNLKMKINCNKHKNF